MLLQFGALFERLEQIFNNPPKIRDVRFEDPVFRSFHDELTSKFTQIMEENILIPNFIPENIIIELKKHFSDFFGNQFRLDYGAGHELNFFCFLLALWADLLILHKVKKILKNYLLFKILFKYVLFVRKLQVDYMLEPAGVRDV